MISTVSRIIKILPRNFRIKSILLSIGIFINSIFEIIGLAAILPLLAVILKDGFLEQNHILMSAYKFFGFNSTNSFIVALCLIVLSFSIFKSVLGLFIQKKQFEFTFNLHEKLTSIIVDKVYRRGFSYFTKNNSNQILNNVHTVPQQFGQQLLINLFQFFNEIAILTLIIISLIAYDYLILLLLSAIVLPVFTVFFMANKKKVKRFGRRLNDLTPEISKPVYEVIFGYVDVVINGVFRSFKNQYLDKIKEAKSIRTNLLIIQNIPNRLIEICIILSVVVMLVYGIYAIEDKDKIMALISIFGLASYRTVPSINRLMVSMINIKNYQFTIDIIESFLREEESTVSGNEIDLNERVLVEKISFSYADNSKKILDELTLEIKKGSAVGIMGKSGSGKTTLMNILLGFLSPTSGEIYIDGSRLEGSNLASWQRKCGYVRQDVFLVDGSLLENVAFGISIDEIDLDQFRRAIKQAQLEDLLESLPEGENTNVGERGARISGGQRQRIGIARALYHGAEVLFFDEATSALDMQTEQEITEAIRSLHQSNLTMVIIAHRETTLKYCDEIIRLS